jgi:molecular chaperone DnaJ
MTTRESYRLLGVNSRTKWEEVRRRFRILVQKCHPDRNPNDPEAAARFCRLKEAYETVRAHQARTPRSDKRYYRTPRSAQRDFFEEVLGMQPEEEPPAASVGPDFRYDLRIAFADAVLGLKTTIDVPRLAPCRRCEGSGRAPAPQPQICPACQGRGRPVRGPGLFRSGSPCRRCGGAGLVYERPCPACEGKGHLVQSRNYRLNIPAGTEDGARFRFVGEGGESFVGGPPGNLEVVVSVEPHEFFTRKGRDLYCKYKISFAQAALGGEVQVPTLAGVRHPEPAPGHAEWLCVPFGCGRRPRLLPGWARGPVRGTGGHHSGIPEPGPAGNFAGTGAVGQIPSDASRP